MNSVNCIKVDKLSGFWAFDDPSRGLLREVLTAGIPTMIETICAVKRIEDPEKGILITFSSSKLPVFDLELKKVYGDVTGTFYRWGVLEGWLCPALFKYFDSAPESIYVKVEALK